MLIPLRISRQPSDIVHDQALSCSNQIRQGGTHGWNQNIVQCGRYGMGIVDGLMAEHAPIKEYFRQGTHGIGIKDIDKGNASRNNNSTVGGGGGGAAGGGIIVIVIIIETQIRIRTQQRTPSWCDQRPCSFEDNDKGSSQPLILLKGKKNV